MSLFVDTSIWYAAADSSVSCCYLLVLAWRHNQPAYKRRYSQWERSFLCQRCGTLAEQE